MADEWKLITSVSEIPATMSRWPSWSEVTGKPSTFAPSAHTHDWDDISGKPSTFAPSSHTHTWAQVTGKPSWITTNDGSGSGIDADLLDGTHKSGLFTAMSYSSNKLSITVGGTTKSVTIQAGSSGSYLPLSGGTLTGTLISNGSIQLKNNLFIQGSSTPQGVYFVINSSGDMTFAGHSNATWTKTYGKIAYSTGNVGIGSAYATNGFQNGSDVRYKHILADLTLTPAQVAAAPAFLFRWKDGTDRALHAGTSAQYWRDVLPQVVMEGGDGRLSMQYGVAALLSAVAVARSVIDHEERLKKLEAAVKVAV